MFSYTEIITKIYSASEMQPTADLRTVAREVQSLHITRNTLHLEILPELRHLESLTIDDADDFCFNRCCLATQITHLSVNAHRIKDLQPLSNLVNLKGLQLSDNTKASSLDWLGSLTALQVLSLENCPITVDISPIAFCKFLRFVWLSSNYTKPMRINSLVPLSELFELERLVLKNVRVADRKLGGLHSLKNLISIELPDFFPKKEFLALAAALPNAKGYWLDVHKQKAES